LLKNESKIERPDRPVEQTEPASDNEKDKGSDDYEPCWDIPVV
jgi:hypothetical protein